jgi:hypothetical protein
MPVNISFILKSKLKILSNRNAEIPIKVIRIQMDIIIKVIIIITIYNPSAWSLISGGG